MEEEDTNSKTLLLDGSSSLDNEKAFFPMNSNEYPKKKKRNLWCALVTLIAVIVSAIVVVSILRVVQNNMDTPTHLPEIPENYEASITIRMPYNGLVEPIYVHMDDTKGLQKLSYYGGMDTYIFNETGSSFQIVPVINTLKCFSIPPSPLQHIFPNLSIFTPQSGIVYVNGARCHSWKFVVEGSSPDSDGLLGSYVFYADAETYQPVQFYYTGHNVMLGGSHVDEYYIDYHYIRSGEIDISIFTQTPSVMDCQPFNTSSSKKPSSNPLHDLHMFFPEGHKRKRDTFHEFKSLYAKGYNYKELPLRISTFHNNVRYINSMNRKGLSYHLAVNHLADRTMDEMLLLSGVSTKYNRQRPLNNEATGVHQMQSKPEDLPTEKDWRGQAVTKVKDQGMCGSCWTYGTTGALEGAYYRKFNKLIELSQQNLLDCSWSEGNYGCDGGLDFQAYRWILKNGGIQEASTYGPYLNVNGFCHYNASKKVLSMTGYVNVSESSGFSKMDALNDALYHIGPLSVSIDATRPSFYFYAGGLYTDETCKSDLDSLDHSVLAVGYVSRDGQKYTIIKNSWSSWWGDKGFAYISQKDNICGVATSPTYPLIAN